MKIRSLNIKNFKSIVDITINEPNPFTVFVGPNGCGKSNIFEALESMFLPTEVVLDLIGGIEAIKNKNYVNLDLSVLLSIIINEKIEDFKHINFVSLTNHFLSTSVNEPSKVNLMNLENETLKKREKFNFSRIFVDKSNLLKLNLNSNRKLSLDCSNLELVLSRLLETEYKTDIFDWLNLFIPEFERIEVKKSNFSAKQNLLIYQKFYEEPFDKKFISDGTYNIIALLTAVFQSDEPQFLCIEEPENGLNPKVVKELVNLFRDACDMYGHYIWINTHSQTLVSQLEEHELIIVDKIEGETKIKQFKKGDFYGMKADEALLTNTLGGGNPW